MIGVERWTTFETTVLLWLSITKRSDSADIPDVLQLHKYVIRIGEIQLLGIAAHTNAPLQTRHGESLQYGIRVEVLKPETKVIDASRPLSRIDSQITISSPQIHPRVLPCK